MANGDSKYRSRKWILATVSLGIVTVFALLALVMLAKDGGDGALIMGAWVGSDTTILGLYNHYNVAEGKA